MTSHDRIRPVWCGPDHHHQQHGQDGTTFAWELPCDTKPSPEQVMDMLMHYGIDMLWMHLCWPMLKKTIILHGWAMDASTLLSHEQLPWLTEIRHRDHPNDQLVVHFYEKDEKLKTSDLVRIIEHANDLHASHLWIIGRLDWVESCQTTLKTVLDHYFTKNSNVAPEITLWNSERFAFDDTDHQVMPLVTKIRREDLQHLVDDTEKLPMMHIHDPVAVRLNLKPDDIVLAQRSFPNKHFNARIVE